MYNVIRDAIHTIYAHVFGTNTHS